MQSSRYYSTSARELISTKDEPNLNCLSNMHCYLNSTISALQIHIVVRLFALINSFQALKPKRMWKYSFQTSVSENSSPFSVQVPIPDECFGTASQQYAKGLNHTV